MCICVLLVGAAELRFRPVVKLLQLIRAADRVEWSLSQQLKIAAAIWALRGKGSHRQGLGLAVQVNTSLIQWSYIVRSHCHTAI